MLQVFLMEVDYGNTVEERANIKPVQQVISFRRYLPNDAKTKQIIK